MLSGLIIQLKSYSQEKLIPLNYNPVIKSNLSKSSTQPVLKSSANSILILPFIDDFSRDGIYPQTDHWLDSNAFVNSNYPDDPITIGVATLDGIDKYGNPYNINSGSSVIADYLTSLPIDLSGSINDTTIWFSFFYQPQGLGDAPETGDSLVVEFMDSSGTWQHMWSVPGQPDTVFQRVNIRLNNKIFLHNEFQFRFYNYATVNGNRDHWNIDYVILKANAVYNDPIRDNGFIRPGKTLLAEYESMPYQHYKEEALSSNPMVSTIRDSIRDINYGPTSFTYRATITDESGSILFNPTPSTLSGNSNTIVPFSTSLGSFVFPSTAANKATFRMKNYVTITGTQSNLYNDTVKYSQIFDNYYAYDDGSAEIGYGVSGNTGVKMAYKFDVKKADTLRGVRIYFNPTGVNVSNTLFQLCLWDQLDTNANTDHLVYRQINQRPQNIDSINGFAQYLFDTLLVVQPGPIWVGFIQNTASVLIGLGLDRNTDHHDKMYYQVDGYWHGSRVAGSWMMRPLFGDSIYEHTIGIFEPPVPESNIHLFPQPANQYLHVQAEQQNEVSYAIYNATGQLVKTGELSPTLDVATLPDGTYLLIVFSRQHNITGSRTFLIQH